MTTDEQPAAETDQWLNFAEGKVVCPVCDEPIPVPVLARMDPDRELHTRADLTELYAHAWTHPMPEPERNST